MMKNVRSAISGVDLILYLVDGTKEIEQEEKDYFEHLPEPKYLVRTKVDKKGQKIFDSDFKISSLTGENVGTLKEFLISKMPKSENKNFVYDQDFYTDKSVKFLIAEEIRQNALILLKDELPHGIAIDIERFDEKPNITIIEGQIICENERHKGIIIGKGGSVLKKIGSQTREFAENLLGTKVLLKLFVKVEKDWRNKDTSLNKLGY